MYYIPHTIYHILYTTVPGSYVVLTMKRLRHQRAYTHSKALTHSKATKTPTTTTETTPTKAPTTTTERGKRGERDSTTPRGNRRHFTVSAGLRLKELIPVLSEPIDSRAILKAAEENDISLSLIDSLNDLTTDATEWNKFYLLSVGNETIRLTTIRRKKSDYDRGTVKSGHYVLVKKTRENVGGPKGKLRPIIWYYSSQQLSDKAEKEFIDFYKTFKINIVPLVEYTTQPIQAFIGGRSGVCPDSLCGVYCLYYLKYGRAPDKLLPLDSLSAGWDLSDRALMIKDLDIDPKKKMINETTLLKSKIARDTLRLNRQYAKGKI